MSRIRSGELVRYLIAWLVMLLVSILNGMVREFTYGRHVSELQGHQISTLSGIALLGLVIWAFVRFWPPASEKEALATGFFWTTLTAVFEFVFFHFVAGHPWSVLLANYDVFQGRVWVLVLIWVGLAPYIFHRLRE